jgi:hypothetical protein
MGFDVERIARDTEAAHRRVLELGAGLDAYDLALRPDYTFNPELLPAEAVRWGAWGFDADGSALELEIVIAE